MLNLEDGYTLSTPDMHDLGSSVAPAELSDHSGGVIQDVHYDEPAAVINESEARAIVAQQEAGLLERIFAAGPQSHDTVVPSEEEIFIVCSRPLNKNPSWRRPYHVLSNGEQSRVRIAITPHQQMPAEIGSATSASTVPRLMHRQHVG